MSAFWLRTVSVAAVEMGAIRSLEVEEGQQVRRGQIVARLDDDVYQAMLAIAREAMQATGPLEAAKAEWKLHETKSAKVAQLCAEGHARQDELERARADVAIAAARVHSALEAVQLKKLEYEKIRVQLNRRIIRSPINGTINVVRKNPGEFVAPNDPYVVAIVQLDPLLATFSVPSYEARELRVGQRVSVFLEDVQKFVDGEIQCVAPVTEAESGTVRVKVRIPNAEHRYRSGERCTLQWDQNKATSPVNSRGR